MATPLEKRKTIFNNGVPKYTKVQTEYSTALLGTTPPGTGTVNPKSTIPPPIPKTYQQVTTEATNAYVQKLNNYPYIERRNDILQIGDSRGRGEKYPPEILLHSTGGPGYFGKDVQDFFVRGGIVQSSAIAAEDVARITNFFASPKGLLWIIREQGLQMTNPRPETRLYNPATTLLNVASQHLGAHLTRHGVSPFSEGQGNFFDFGYNTYSTIRDYAGQDDPGGIGKSFTANPFVTINRPSLQPKLLDLVSEMQLGRPQMNLSSISLQSLLSRALGGAVSGYVSPRDKAAGGPEIGTISYLSAANAPYGGFSLFGNGIHRSVNTLLDIYGDSTHMYPRESNPNAQLSLLTRQAKELINNPVGAVTGLLNKAIGQIQNVVFGAINPAVIQPSVKIPRGTSDITPNPDLLKTYKSLAYGELGKREKMYVSPDNDLLVGPSDGYLIYPKLSLRKSSKREHLLGNRGFSDPGNPAGSSPDMINSIMPTAGEIEGGELFKYDLVPLVFYDIANDLSIVFRAVLNGITDTITPEWNEYNYIGNPQTYYTYKRTTRDFGFSFKIYCDTERELKWNWMKLNRFVGMMYPAFVKGNERRMVGPFLKLTIGDMLHRMPGYMSGLTITVDDNTPWEINLFNDGPLAKVPHMVDCAVTFRVIGDMPLEGKSTQFYAQNKMYKENWQFDERKW